MRRLATTLSGIFAGLALAVPASAPAPPPAHEILPRIDFTFVHLAIQFLETGSTFTLYELSGTGAAVHLLRHARYAQIDVPTRSTVSLVSYLLTPREEKAADLTSVRRLVAVLESEERSRHRTCVEQARRYLPGDYAYAGVLFFTYGYGLGVSLGDNASLNLAHTRFRERPEEVWLYCIGQLFRVGYHFYHPPPYISSITTTRDLQRLVEYGTQLEGMAIHAAYEQREKQALLDADEDYVVLRDSLRMVALEDEYFRLYYALRQQEDRPLTPDDWGILEAMERTDRLWYRVGALMARRIERAEGRSKLRRLVYNGPRAFISTYESLVGR